MLTFHCLTKRLTVLSFVFRVLRNWAVVSGNVFKLLNCWIDMCFLACVHRIFEFRKIIGDREKCKYLVPEDYPVYINKVLHLFSHHCSPVSLLTCSLTVVCVFVCNDVSRQRSTPTVRSTMGSSSLLWSTWFRESCHQRPSKPGRKHDVVTCFCWCDDVTAADMSPVNKKLHYVDW